MDAIHFRASFEAARMCRVRSGAAGMGDGWRHGVLAGVHASRLREPIRDAYIMDTHVVPRATHLKLYCLTSGAARRSSCPMSLPKLTSLSTQTLSLLLERQRLQTLSPSPRSAGLTQAPQITKNLTQLRAGIIELEENEGRTEAVTLLRSQFERMRSMLGDGGHVERYVVSNSSSASGTLL